MRRRSPPEAPATLWCAVAALSASSSVSEAICPSSSVRTRASSPNGSVFRAATMTS